MQKAKILGFFTNHSVRCSGRTRLFRRSIDHKLIKESAGHHSDAVDEYTITGIQQRREMSNVINGQNSKDNATLNTESEEKAADKIGDNV